MFDYIIIGGGIVGSSIARALTKYNTRVALIEKEADVSLGASKANSGIVHGGYAGTYGTLKGDLCIRGNKMYDHLNQELNFGFKRIGGLILGFDGDKEVLDKQYNNGLQVGEEMKWVTKEDVLSLEPSVNPDVAFGLYVKNIGITSPYEMTIAMTENAVLNGLKLFLEHDVKSITYDDHYNVQTNNGVIEGRFIINAAGIHSGHINDMLGNYELTIHPRRGQYVLFCKDQNKLNHVVFQTPTVKGKGILVTPTVHGNLMVGPDAEDLLEEVTTATSVDRLKSILDQARKSVDTFSPKRALTTFSGVRAISSTKDFFIKYVNENAITVGGIDSPGLTSAPAIAMYVIDLIKEKYELVEKLDFDPIRNSYYDKENDELICLCESQGKSRIKACLEGPIKIQTTDAVKRRVRAGMGNCQGARCESKVKELISEFNHTSIDEVLKRTESTVPKRVSLKEIRGITFEN